MTPTSPISFRRLNVADLSMLREWLMRPHVAEWWGDGAEPPPDLASLTEEYTATLARESPVKPYIAEHDGCAIGFIQSYVAMGAGDGWWETETDPGVRGIDQFLADGEHLGRGLGTQMVRAFIQQVLQDSAVTRIQTDPDPTNTRAIRSYVKAGFTPVGEISTPDGPALLMAITREAARSPEMQYST
jgi:RimJ/RimL family protein N-acetyltransferase